MLKFRAACYFVHILSRVVFNQDKGRFTICHLQFDLIQIDLQPIRGCINRSEAAWTDCVAKCPQLQKVISISNWFPVIFG